MSTYLLVEISVCLCSANTWIRAANRSSADSSVGQELSGTLKPGGKPEGAVSHAMSPIRTTQKRKFPSAAAVPQLSDSAKMHTLEGECTCSAR